MQGFRLLKSFSRIKTSILYIKRFYLINPNCHEIKKPIDLCLVNGYVARPSLPFDRISEKEAQEKLNLLSDDEKKQLKILKLEYDVFYSTGVRVPDQMTDEMWVKILKYKTPSSRKKLYNFWFVTEKKQLNEKKKKSDAAAKKLEEKETENTSNNKQDFFRKIHFFIRDTTMNKHYYNNLVHAMRFGPPLIFDMAFEDKMSNREIKNIITQFQLCHSRNKTESQPFHFSFFNVQKSGRFFNQLQFFGQDLNNIPWTVSSDNYLDVYDNSKLIYLSPNATHVMKKYDHDAIYIIGGIVDTSIELPLTFAKSKKEVIECQRFPIEHYLNWTKGSKSLTLDQVVNILHSIKKDNDWSNAFQFVPRRKTFQN